MMKPTALLKKQLLNTLDDLTVQSMIFDMDIDYETLTLQPRSDYKEPFWLTNWKEKESGKDFDNIDNGF